MRSAQVSGACRWGATVAALPIVGGYAEYLCLAETELVRVPPWLDPARCLSDRDALTAACLDDPDDEGRLAVLADGLEERGDARADAVRRVPRWRAAVSAARPEEIPNDSEDLAGLLRVTAEVLGAADARLWACACLRLLPPPFGGAAEGQLARPARRRVVAAAEPHACGLLGVDEARAVRAEALGAETGPRKGLSLVSFVNADPGRAVVWAAAEPDVGRAVMTLLGASLLFLGPEPAERRARLARQAVAAADRMLREIRPDRERP
jgi:hypothetical protein